MKKDYNFDIIFTEYDKLTQEPEFELVEKDNIEYDEIRTLMEIVDDIQRPQPSYFTST